MLKFFCRLFGHRTFTVHDQRDGSSHTACRRCRDGLDGLEFLSW